MLIIYATVSNLPPSDIHDVFPVNTAALDDQFAAYISPLSPSPTTLTLPAAKLATCGAPFSGPPRSSQAGLHVVPTSALWYAWSLLATATTSVLLALTTNGAGTLSNTVPLDGHCQGSHALRHASQQNAPCVPSTKMSSWLPCAATAAGSAVSTPPSPYHGCHVPSHHIWYSA